MPAAAGALLLVVGGVLSGCSFGPTRDVVPIPPGIPPGPGEAVPPVDLDAPGRTSEQLTDWAEPISDSTGIPRQAVAAYGNAAETMRQTVPGCHLAWTTLAGIGRVETRHGTYHGSRLDEAGVARPTIVGVPLDGSPGFAEVADTDGGAIDGDAEHDRAVGPMQFIPQSWRRYGRDADGDGRADPNQIDDAAVGAARLLCDTGSDGTQADLATAEGWRTAVLAYNASTKYLTDVRDAAAAYSVGTTAP